MWGNFFSRFKKNWQRYSWLRHTLLGLPRKNLLLPSNSLKSINSKGASRNKKMKDAIRVSQIFWHLFVWIFCLSVSGTFYWKYILYWVKVGKTSFTKWFFRKILEESVYNKSWMTRVGTARRVQNTHRIWNWFWCLEKNVLWYNFWYKINNIA